MKMVVTPTAAIVFLIWCIIKAHGIGPIVQQPASIHGSNLAWAMVVSLMSCISNSVTLLTSACFVHFSAPHLTFDTNRNAPDFASRARTPAAAVWPQLFALPLSSSIVCLIGILVSSSSRAIYGEVIWSPIDLLNRFLDDNPSPATRFGVCSVLTTFTLSDVAHPLTRYGSSPSPLLLHR